MKTAMKFTAIAVAAALVALSCAPEVELSSRDLGEYNDANRAEYTSAPGTTGINVTTFYTMPTSPYNYYLPYSIYGSTSLPERLREIYIEFPNDADVVKVSNADILAELQKFFTIHTYTNKDQTLLPGYANGEVAYTPSDPGAALPYTFVERRNTSANATTITIRLNSVPNEYTIVWRVNAAEYRRKGQLVDTNGDYIGGEVFDDRYGEIEITGATLTATATTAAYGSFVWPFANVSVTVDTTGFGGISFKASEKILSPVVGVSSFGGNTAQNRKILSDILGLNNIEVQKYNQTTKEWAKETAAAFKLFEYDAAKYPPAALDPLVDNTIKWTTALNNVPTYDNLYFTLTPADLGIYRVKAAGTKAYETTLAGSTVKAKVIVNSDAKSDTVLGGLSLTYLEDRQWVPAPTTSGDLAKNVIITSDNSLKNVVIKLFVDPITYKPDPLDSTKDVITYLPTTTPAPEVFNQNVKLLYNKTTSGGNVTWPLTGSTDNVVEIKITDVKYERDTRFNSAFAAGKNNVITLTLDPDYKHDTGKPITLLLNTGFLFDNAKVTFGANSAIANTLYDGTFLWERYGNWSNTSYPNVEGLPPPPPPPDTPALSAPTVTASSVTINWTPVTGATGYKVYRSINYYSFTVVGTVNSPPFIDYNVNSSSTYYYKVTAVNSFGSESDQQSIPQSATTLWATPSAPIALTADTWGTDTIATAGGLVWFSFTATDDDNDGIQYIHFDVTSSEVNDVYVQVYDNNGDAVGIQKNLYGSTTNHNISVTASDAYYIKVWAYTTSNTGTVILGFTDSTTPPSTGP